MRFFFRRPPRCRWDDCTARPLLDDTLCLNHRLDAILVYRARNIRRLCVNCGRREQLLTLDWRLAGLCCSCQVREMLEMKP